MLLFFYLKSKQFVTKSLLLILLLSSCSTTKNASTTPQKKEDSSEKPLEYQASYTKLNDLIHTKLEVSFDWQMSYLCGKANLKLQPYFYPTQKLILDAKGMDIKKLQLVTSKGNQDLNYTYDSLKIHIDLDREYNKGEAYEIHIEYIAKPDELEEGGSAAITSDKGLYFINSKNKTKNKPQQIWTQGETEASSCWFPTIDAPNEKMTQEIYITVDSKYKTLSNGLLISSNINADGTRTDYWYQNIKHAPYLAMMAIGEFAVIEDNWRNKTVNYYVEKEYEPYARQIFGNTPEMMEFYSQKLGFDYPWDKYHQVVVRDYVSGAMENTGAVIFGEFIQRDSREMLDRTDEDIVAHELFHHWFGDLVTCESWSNLPLNESFATYGEVLWMEHKYGTEAAEYHAQQDLTTYLAESKRKQVDMIRYHYNEREDMFDRHTYQKGGRILHMLRNYVGDDAFFASLKKYLHDNAFSTVEIHNLRLAFEEVTGEDLNWFFNQWFLASGHPILDIQYSYDDSLKQQTVYINQKQDLKKTPLYKLPITIDIYEKGKVTSHKVTLTKQNEVLTFKSTAKPELVNVDAHKVLLCEKTDTKSSDEWAYQYKNAPLYLDRYEAIEKLAKEKDGKYQDVLLIAFDDDYWNIRKLAISKLNYEDSLIKNKALARLKAIATDDEKSAVRATALATLIKHYKKDSLIDLYTTAVYDSSYTVMSQALKGIVATDSLGLEKIEQYQNSEASKVLVALAKTYTEKGDSTHNNFYHTKLESCKGFDQYQFIKAYNGYIVNQNDSVVEASVDFIEDHSRNNETWYLRLAALRCFQSLNIGYDVKIEAYDKQLKKLGNKSKNRTQKLALVTKRAKAIELQGEIKTLFDEITESEKNDQVIKYLGLK